MADDNGGMAGLIAAITGPNSGMVDSLASKVDSVANMFSSTTNLLSAIKGEGNISPTNRGADSSAAANASNNSREAATQSAGAVAQAVMDTHNAALAENARVSDIATSIVGARPDAQGNSVTLADQAAKVRDSLSAIQAKDAEIKKYATANPLESFSSLGNFLVGQVMLPIASEQQKAMIDSALGQNAIIAGIQAGADKSIQMDVATNKAFNDTKVNSAALEGYANNLGKIQSSQAQFSQLAYAGAENILAADKFGFEKLVQTQQLANDQVRLKLATEQSQREAMAFPANLEHIRAATALDKARIAEFDNIVGSDKILTGYLQANGPMFGLPGGPNAPDARIVKSMSKPMADYLKLATMSPEQYPGNNPADRFLQLNQSGLAIKGAPAMLSDKFINRVMSPAVSADPNFNKYDAATQAALLQVGRKAEANSKGLLPSIKGLGDVTKEDMLNRDSGDTNFYHLGTLSSTVKNPQVQDNVLTPLLSTMASSGGVVRPFSGKDVFAAGQKLIEQGTPMQVVAQETARYLTAINETNNAVMPYAKFGIAPADGYKTTLKLSDNWGAKPEVVDMANASSVFNAYARITSSKNFNKAITNSMQQGIQDIIPIPKFDSNSKGDN